MDNLSSIMGSTTTYSGQNVAQTKDASKTDKTANSKAANNYGKTIGKPKLSEKAAKYYEELKNKFSDLDFILVSSDQKEQAKAQAANYANKQKMVVLIDEEKIERMAEDENYRKQYESVIANSKLNMSKLGDSVFSTGANVKGFGMQVNDDGTASYFAVLKKSSAAQKARIEKKTAEKKAEKKAEAKEAAKEQMEERLEEIHDNRSKTDTGNTVTITAGSIEELVQKINDQAQLFLSDSVQTEEEKYVGQKFDFSV